MNNHIVTKHFLIYTNQHKDRNLETTTRICEYLQGKEQRVSVMTEDGEEKKSMPKDIDCMIVLGGDGTMLQAAGKTGEHRIPMIGVNLGTLGYLTEIEPAGLEGALDRLIEGSYSQESRMMLEGRVELADGGRREGWALNDIVISRCGSLRIIKFNIYVNGQFLHDYIADGVIVTTPTGSTGYNLSAGGPLIEPKAQLIMLTPICPHSLNQRSIILSAEDVIEIEIPRGRDDTDQSVEVHFDGGHSILLKTGDRVQVNKAGRQTEFIRLNQVSFLEVLHQKMKNG